MKTKTGHQTKPAGLHFTKAEIRFILWALYVAANEYTLTAKDKAWKRAIEKKLSQG